MVKQLVIIQKYAFASLVPIFASLCGICSSTDHLTDCCPTLHEIEFVGSVPQAYVAKLASTTIVKLGSVIYQVRCEHKS